MKTTRVADLRRWTEELANDPDSLAFIPLARVYRRMGRADAALKLCIRGVQRNPANAEARNLLARLYVDAGERDMAADAWSEALRLDADSFEAHRGLAFYRLEHGDWVAARRHLEAAARLRPGDPLISGAIEFLDQQATSSGSPTGGEPLPGAAAEFEEAAPAEGVGSVPTGAGTAEEPAPAGLVGPDVGSAPIVPGPAPRPEKFTGIAGGDARVLGAIVLDRRGLVVEGDLAPALGTDRDTLAASLGAAVEEAARTVGHLELGDWRGLGFETPTAMMHLSPLGGGYTLLLIVRADAPPGWVARLAERAAAYTRRNVEALA